MSFADAINAAMQAHVEHARDYGGYLAQADIPLEEADDLGELNRYVAQGYARQLHDFPQG